MLPGQASRQRAPICLAHSSTFRQLQRSFSGTALPSQGPTSCRLKPRPSSSPVVRAPDRANQLPGMSGSDGERLNMQTCTARSASRSTVPNRSACVGLVQDVFPIGSMTVKAHCLISATGRWTYSGSAPSSPAFLCDACDRVCMRHSLQHEGSDHLSPTCGPASIVHVVSSCPD